MLLAEVGWARTSPGCGAQLNLRQGLGGVGWSLVGTQDEGLLSSGI